MGCGEFLVKYILFITNLAFALAGLALLGLGIAVQLQVSAITDLTDSSYKLAPISTMVIGGIVFIIAFFGCCGAIRENNCMLVTYSIFMLVLMIVKLALAILLFVRLDDIVAEVPNVLDEAFKKDQTGYNALQAAFNCCGTTGPGSYTNVTLPATCCSLGGDQCTQSNSYPGCNTIIGDFIHTFGLAIGVVAIVVVAIELVAVVFGLCLANHVRNKYRRTRY